MQRDKGKKAASKQESANKVIISIIAFNTRDAQIWNGISPARTPNCGNTDGPAIKNRLLNLWSVYGRLRLMTRLLIHLISASSFLWQLCALGRWPYAHGLHQKKRIGSGLTSHNTQTLGFVIMGSRQDQHWQPMITWQGVSQLSFAGVTKLVIIMP